MRLQLREAQPRVAFSAMRAIGFLLLVLIGRIAFGQELPEVRPALIGRSPGAIINRIDTKTLMAAQQKEGLVMFCAIVDKTGDVSGSATYLGTPDSKLLAQEVDRALTNGKMIPAIRNHEPIAVMFFGTVVFSLVDGKPRLRLFANQDVDELKKESDFIAPQPCIGGESKFSLRYPENGSPVPLSAIVNLQISVDAAGNLQSAKVIDESPPLLGYGEAATEDFSSAKFIPAFREGKPVAAQTTLSVYYQPKS
jgi:hypothetical protein